MAAEKGSAFVLKVGDGATSETFTTVGGMRTTTFSLNGETVDVSDKDTPLWRELLGGAGLLSATVTGAGVFKDTASEETVRSQAFAQSIDNYQLAFEDGDTIEGAFQITSLEYAGEHNGARTYSITLESAGALTYTSA